jgi:hypothetical protein
LNTSLGIDQHRPQQLYLCLSLKQSRLAHLNRVILLTAGGFRGVELVKKRKAISLGVVPGKILNKS